MKDALPESAAGKPVEIWFQDEARVGQQGSLEYIWAPKGSRPRAVRDNRRDSVYLFGALCWSIGSVSQRRLGSRAHPFVIGGVQQLATGVVYLPPALLEPTHTEWTTKGLLAVAYLAVFGGLVGYSAFIYAMLHLPVTMMSIYTYINPLVAVALGWWFYREPFGWRETAAMFIIFAGVSIVKLAAGRRLRADESSVPPQE